MKSQTTEGTQSGSVAHNSEDTYECLVGQSPIVEVMMGGVRIKCLLDTGSMVTTITEVCFKQHFYPTESKKLKGWH